MNDRASNPSGPVAPVTALQLPYPYLLFLGDATEAAYKRTTFFDQRVQLMEMWAQFLLPSDTATNVVRMSGRTGTSSRCS